MFEDSEGAGDDERMLAIYRRLEEAVATGFADLTQEQLMDLWVDAEELNSWAINRRLEAIRELRRRREAC